MNFFAYNRMGESIPEPNTQVMQSLLASVSEGDPEHPCVSLNTEDGWAISYHPSHTLIFENVETGEGPWHLKDVSPEAALLIWKQLSQGLNSDLKNKGWVAGYGN